MEILFSKVTQRNFNNYCDLSLGYYYYSFGVLSFNKILKYLSNEQRIIRLSLC